MKFFLILLAVSMLSNCTLSVPQAEAMRNFVSSLTNPGSSATSHLQPTWLASVGEVGAIVKPYSADGFVVFANNEGDAIAFDGWSVRSIMGFGLPSPITITGKDGRRTFIQNEKTAFTYCDPWERRELAWFQVCGDGDGEITLTSEGEITGITMSLGESFGIVTLQVDLQVSDDG